MLWRSFWLGLLFAVAGSAAAQYPSYPVKLVITFPPGGPADTLTRLVHPVFQEQLGGAVELENRSGGGGAIGFSYVARSKPDGYTLLATTSAPLTLGSALRKLDFGLDDFEYVGAFGADSTAIVSRPDAPWKTFGELIAYAKKHPGKLTYASPGAATAPFLTMEAIKTIRGVEFTAVQYKGTGPVRTAILGGHADFAVGGFAALKELIRANRLTVLAITGKSRDRDFPDTPTLADEGLDAANIDLWAGLWAPKGTPQEILDKLGGALQKAANDPEVAKKLAAAGYKALWEPAGAMRTSAEQDHQRAQKIVSDLKLRKP